MAKEKPIQWLGSSLKDLLVFPEGVKRHVGYQLHRVQNGLEAEDWKSFSAIGSGVNEIRVRDEAGIYRVIYIAKFSEALYVLHSFQKKTQKTAKADIDLAKSRFKAIEQLRN